MRSQNPKQVHFGSQLPRIFEFIKKIYILGLNPNFCPSIPTAHNLQTLYQSLPLKIMSVPVPIFASTETPIVPGAQIVAAEVAWPASTLQPPAQVITIADRHIRVAGAGLEDASLYNMCRQWAYNTPVPTMATPEDHPILPPIQRPAAPPTAPAADDPRLDVGGSELTDFADIEAKQRQRWKAVGESMKREAAERRAPYVQRLAATLNPAR